MPDRIFKTQGEVLDYLHGLGLKIGRSKLSDDYRSGVLPCQPDKSFLEKDVLIYADTLRAPGFARRQKSDRSPKEESQQFRKMVLDFCAALPDLARLEKTLAKWLQKDWEDSIISEKLDECQIRVARRLENDRKMQEKLKALQAEKAEWQARASEKDKALTVRFRRHQRELSPDLVRLPEVPGGYDALEDFDPHARFCLTGVFAYGGRGECEELVRKLGGKVAKEPALTEQTYVVVGTLASLYWSHGVYGNKIGLGLQYREQGAPVKIISEDDWIKAVLEAEQKK